MNLVVKDGIRPCRTCGKSKSVSDFSGRTNRASKTASRCRECMRPTTRWKRLKERYGIDRETFERMTADQGGLCAICHRPPQIWRHLDVDHCHETNRVRGLLCRKCNVGIGAMEDVPDRMRAAAAYIESHRKASE